LRHCIEGDDLHQGRQIYSAEQSCYARAERRDLDLARQTRGYFIEPENLLTITVPTGLPPKDALHSKEKHPVPLQVIIERVGKQMPKYWWRTASVQQAGAGMNRTSPTSFLATDSLATPGKSMIPTMPMMITFISS